MVVCVSCGTASPDDFRFCPACAAPLGSSGAAPREERRTVTVLFADLAGFTSRSEALDPEDVRAFLVPYYDALTTEVTGHGGHVDRFLGDGIMALFGAPTAHEDDPERAVRAALRIVERVPALGLDLHVRVGINTGPVLFVAAEGDRDDAVTGDAVNTAARLQAAAPTDGVVVGEATYRATSHLFRYEALEPIRAKGKAELVPLWRPLERIARVGGELHPETTPFVGRAFELETLVRLFERAKTTPSLEVVTVVADPGIGKSRLVRELARHVDALPELVTWRVGRCLPYGDGISFWALGEIIAAQAGILETDDQVTLAAKLEAALTEPDPAMRIWMRDRIAPLVGLRVTVQPPEQEEAFTAWRRFLESLARTGPTVLVVEDLHWADDAMVAFLLHVVANTAGVPLLIVATARPELEERHEAWLGRARRNTVISLDALADHDLASLVEAALPDAVPRLVTTILERSGGSPLYAEQLVALIRERDGALDESAVPPGIAALLAARIDALPTDVKPALLDASVVGKTFWTGAVATLSGREPSDVEPAMTDLARRELTRPAFPSTMDGEAEHTFWHALVRDVAYAALPRAARMAKHRAAAAWIAERGGSSGRLAEIVAEHYGRALELAEATGASAEAAVLRDALVTALLGSAEQAMRTEPERGLAHLRSALARMAPVDERRADALERLGWALVTLYDFEHAVPALEEARALLLARGDGGGATRAAVPLSVALTNFGRSAQAAEVLAEARVAASAAPGPGLLAVMAEQAMLSLRSDRWDEGRALAVETVRLADALGLPPPARALMGTGVEANIHRAVDVALAEGDLRTASNGFYNLAATFQGGYEQMMSAIDAAIAFDVAHGLSGLSARRYRLTGRLWAQPDGEAAELAELAELIGEARASGDAFNALWGELALTQFRMERGESIEAAIDAMAASWQDAALSLSALDFLRAKAALLQGDRARAQGHLEAIVDRLAAGESSPDPGEMVELCVRAGRLDLARWIAENDRPSGLIDGVQPRDDVAALGLAMVDFAAGLIVEGEGQPAAALPHLESALATMTRLGWVVVAAGIERCLGRCLLAVGESGPAVEHLLAARETLLLVGFRPQLEEIDALLALVGTS